MSRRAALIIAAKDAEDTIGRAVLSALAQPEAQEVIVVDDGSTDGTAAAARRADDGSARLRVHSLPRNLGPSAARNAAIGMSQAPWLAVLDADDFLLPGRLARLFAAAGDADLPDLLADDLLMARSGAEEGPHTPFGAVPRGTIRKLDLKAFVRGNMADPRRPRAELGFVKPLMRRAFLDQHDLRYDPAVRLGEDYLLYAGVLARGGSMWLVPACGYVAVTRPGSLSHRHGAADLARLKEGDDALLALPGLPAEDRAAIAAHRAQVQHKHLHRAALDAKRRGDWLGAMRFVFQSPAAARHILGQTLRDKVRPG